MAVILLPDGSRKPVADGATVAELAREAGLADSCLAGRVGDRLLGLDERPPAGAEVVFVLRGSNEALELLRHSTAHVMAEAVTRIFGKVRLGIGPAIEDGFYYDFELDHQLSAADFGRIEAEMRCIVAEDRPFVREELTRAEALKLLEAEGQTYKLELLRELPDERVTFYGHDGFRDMCRGPHLPRTSDLGAFKLLSVAGAYWRGSEHRPMLQRIYGTAFWTEEDLKKHLAYLEEVKHRDHRVLGPALGYYSIDEDIGPGLVLWHPRGALVRHIIEEFWRSEHLKRGYQLVYTPHIASERIYERSGHLENYAESMYAPMDIENRPYRLKPMNCPGHIKIYQSQQRSYRDLPMRLCELGTVYRFERSGTLHGLLRVRGFTQDDAHIFCTPEQLPGELVATLELADAMMRAFGFRYEVFLATRPEKALGSEAEWERSLQALRTALAARNLPYQIDEGGGAFYGPKIDIKLRDAIGREWTGPTVQVDLNLPKRFGATYIGPDNAEHEVVIVHRTVIGSMERFVGALLEHYAGALPLWLAPEQVRVITIADAHAEYADKVAEELRRRGFRATADVRNEKTGAKIRRAALEKVPYALVVGDRELQQGTVSVRHRKLGDQGPSTLDAFVARLVREVEARM